MTRKLFKEVFRIKETQGTIIADREQGVKTAIASIKRNRKALEDYARRNSLFLVVLEPVAVPAEPLVARLMAEAAEKANVGHMAAVAGQRNDNIEISLRCTREFNQKTGIHLGKDIAKPLGESLQGMGGGHATAAGVNGTGDVETGLKRCLRLLKEELAKHK